MARRSLRPRPPRWRNAPGTSRPRPDLSDGRLHRCLGRASSRRIPRPVTISGRLLACKGIAEGVENSNYFLHTETGNFILTLYEKRVAAEDLPFFLEPDGAPRGAGHHLPLAGARIGTGARRLARLSGAGRPPSSPSSMACGSRQPDVRALRLLSAARIAELHRAGADFALRRPNNLSVDSVARRFSTPRNPDADGGLPGPFGHSWRDELDHGSPERWPRGLPEGRHPCGSVPRQRVLHRRAPVGADRLLLRLHRCARLRPGDLPERLVLRAGRPLRHRARLGPCSDGYTGGAAAVPGEEVACAARCSPADRRSASF